MVTDCVLLARRACKSDIDARNEFTSDRARPVAVPCGRVTLARLTAVRRRRAVATRARGVRRGSARVCGVTHLKLKNKAVHRRVCSVHRERLYQYL